MRIPLAHELHLGPMVILEREYVVVRVTTTDGNSGCAYALSRGAPVDIAVTDLVGPRILGLDPESISEAWERWEGAFVSLGMTGILARAVSLVDIALWDIRATARGEPLWRLLGSARTESDVMIVEGYPRLGESAEEFAERLGSRSDAGFSWIKIANIPDLEDMTDRLQATRDRCPDANLVIDIAWAWRYRSIAIHAARRWADFELRWIEDPVPADQVEIMGDLRRMAPARVGAGDEVSDLFHIGALIESDAIDVLRLDALTIGGITGFLRARKLAQAAGLPVSPHIYPEVHRHLAFAFEDVGPVETYGTSGEFDRTVEFVAVDEAPVASAPNQAGVGIQIDWPAVEIAAIRRSEVRA